MRSTAVVTPLVAAILISGVSSAQDSKRSESKGCTEQTPSWCELRELESLTANALRLIIRLTRERDLKLDGLLEKQKAAANHLDGDLWLEDITLEIQKTAFSYESRIEAANRTLDRLSGDLDALREKLNSTEENADQGEL